MSNKALRVAVNRHFARGGMSSAIRVIKSGKSGKRLGRDIDAYGPLIHLKNVEPLVDQGLLKCMQESRTPKPCASLVGDLQSYVGREGAPGNGSRPWHKLKQRRNAHALSPYKISMGYGDVLPGPATILEDFADASEHEQQRQAILNVLSSESVRTLGFSPFRLNGFFTCNGEEGQHTPDEMFEYADDLVACFWSYSVGGAQTRPIDERDAPVSARASDATPVMRASQFEQSEKIAAALADLSIG